MKEVGIQKDIFLKTLSNHLFNSYDGHYAPTNILVIDDSPIKHMLNLSENVLLLPTWSYKGDGVGKDSVLMEELLPYLLNLHWFREGLAEYWFLIHLVGPCSIMIRKHLGNIQGS